MNHDRMLESAAAFALDALDASERAAFELHLARCAECRLAVQDYREVSGLLMHATAPEAAPPGLRDRVGRLVQGEVAARPDVARRSSRRATMWLAAAGMALAVAAGAMWREVGKQRAIARDAQLQVARAVATRDSLLASFAGPRLHHVSLSAPGEAQPVARVFWNHERRRFVVTAFQLPRAAEGRAYQLWALAEGRAPVSMGTFNTDASGTATIVLPVGQEIEALGFIAACGITEEPSGGSRAPTEAPRFTGSWRHTD